MSVSKRILDTVLTVPPQDIFHLKHGLALFPTLPVVVLSSHGLYAKLTMALGHTVGWEDWLDARIHWMTSNGCTLAQVPRTVVAEELERIGDVYRVREHGMPFILLEEV